MNKFAQRGVVDISLILVILFFVGVGGFLAWQTYASFQNNSSSTTTPLPSGMPTPIEQDTISETEEEIVPFTGGSSSADAPGISLRAVPPYTGSGKATANWNGNLFTHTVNADLAAPAAGKFYEGWLVSSDDLISTGELSSNGGEYSLVYTSGTDYSSYTSVFITEETLANGLDGIPEAHVLEGEF